MLGSGDELGAERECSRNWSFRPAILIRKVTNRNYAPETLNRLLAAENKTATRASVWRLSDEMDTRRDQAKAFLAISTTAANAASSRTARSASALRSSLTLATLSPCMKLL